MKKIDFSKIKNIKINKNKALLVIAIFLIFIGIGTTIYFSMSNTKDKIADNKVIEDLKDNEEVKEAVLEEEQAEKELEEAKKSGDEKAIKEAEEKVAKVKEKVESVKVAQSSFNAKTESKPSNTTKSSSDTKTNTNTSAKSTSENTNTTTKVQEQPKEKKKVLVKEAWTETIKVPVTKYKPTWWITFRDGSKKIYYNKKEWVNASKTLPEVARWGNGEDEAYTVYEDKVINHPAEYRWE